MSRYIKMDILTLYKNFFQEFFSHIYKIKKGPPPYKISKNFSGKLFTKPLPPKRPLNYVNKGGVT